jgi:hypothetical protein
MLYGIAVDSHTATHSPYFFTIEQEKISASANVLLYYYLTCFCRLMLLLTWALRLPLYLRWQFYIFPYDSGIQYQG